MNLVCKFINKMSFNFKFTMPIPNIYVNCGFSITEVHFLELPENIHI